MGLGYMGMSEFYGADDEQKSIGTIPPTFGIEDRATAGWWRSVRRSEWPKSGLSEDAGRGDPSSSGR